MEHRHTRGVRRAGARACAPGGREADGGTIGVRGHGTGEGDTAKERGAATDGAATAGNKAEQEDKWGGSGTGKAAARARRGICGGERTGGRHLLSTP